jgi:hypothetical protein
LQGMVQDLRHGFADLGLNPVDTLAVGPPLHEPGSGLLDFHQGRVVVIAFLSK